jgi:hypothetical protein
LLRLSGSARRPGREEKSTACCTYPHPGKHRTKSNKSIKAKERTSKEHSLTQGQKGSYFPFMR